MSELENSTISGDGEERQDSSTSSPVALGKDVKLELPDSSESGFESDNPRPSTSQEDGDSFSRSPSPDESEEQWEVEAILDYTKDASGGHMYLVKWKNWESDFNTWEPTSNLGNCDNILYEFYKERKAAAAQVLMESTYVVTSIGKRRRKGPPLLPVPPDPRSVEDRICEFFFSTVPLTEEEISEAFEDTERKEPVWSVSKIQESLDHFEEKKLTDDELIKLREELIYFEVETRKKNLNGVMKKWQSRINKITKGKPFITVENKVDLALPPNGFEYINDYISAAGINIPNDPPVGCECSSKGNSLGCYENRKNCCAHQFGYEYAYTRYKKVNVLPGSPIYECNSKCSCGPDCSNRVVQDGRHELKLCVFRTSNGCGWGVKAMKSIKKGSFVTLYVGEVIRSEDAERRARDSKNGHTYQFDLDFNDQESFPYTVDASKYGNVAHFINHSCNPNLGVYAVWVDCLDPNLPKLAMFALKDISKDEELTFDYKNQQYSPPSENENGEGNSTEPNKKINTVKQIKCLCGSKNCREYLY